MSLRDDLLAEQAEVNRKLAILNSAPSDTYNLGTVVVFASGAGGVNKWHYVKVNEETWKDFQSNGTKSLAEWILFITDLNVGYFEVYVLTVAPAPIYASA